MTETTHIITDGSLSYALVPQAHLPPQAVERMYALMAANYNHINWEMFLHDLAGKTWVGVIRDAEGAIQGFTTFVVNPAGSGGPDYHVLFSGDTIIDPAHWGTQVLMKGWCHTVGRLIATDPTRPWYWYLLSKGHRTYMYLPLFFRVFYPSPTPSGREAELAHIANAASQCLYGDCWKPALGVVQFGESHGELTPDLAEATFRKAKSPNVAFFIQKNPGFAQGDELVCIAPLHPDNLLRTAHEYVRTGMAAPLPAVE